MAYRYEKISPDHIDDLIFIYRDAFGSEVDRSYIYHKQDTSAFGPSFVGYIAYSESGEPAAFYGVFPCLLSLDGQKYLAAQSGDTMTHSNHRGKGLFTQLALKTYEYCREVGVHLVFGFPNENSYPGFTRNLSWQHFDDFQIYLVRVYTLPWTRLKKLLGLSTAARQRWARFIAGRHTAGSPFANSVIESGIGGIDHSTDFFAYKSYGQAWLLQVAGVNVWVKADENFLYIGDMERCDEATFDRALSALKNTARLMGIPHLRFQCSRGAYHEAGFKRHGTLFNKTYPIGGVNFTNSIPIERLKFTLSDNDTF